MFSILGGEGESFRDEGESRDQRPYVRGAVHHSCVAMENKREETGIHHT